MKYISAFLIMMFVAVASVSAEDVVYPCDGANATREISAGGGSVYVCEFMAGEDLDGGWRWSNGVVFVYKYKGLSQVIFQGDEFGLGTAYTFDGDSLVLRHYTEVYPDFDSVPFVMETVHFSGKSLVKTYDVLLKVDMARANNSNLSEWLSFLRISESDYRDLYQDKHGVGALYERLFNIRDYAVKCPCQSNGVLDEFVGAWWNDGEASEVLSRVRNDISLLYLAGSCAGKEKNQLKGVVVNLPQFNGHF